MADYFWVGGNGTWNNTNATNWSLTSGGAGGAGVPTAADTVTINVSSGTGTISVDSTATCGGVSFTSTVTVLKLIADVTLMPSTATFTHSFGTINLNNFNLTVGIWSSNNSSTRQVQFGTGQIKISGSNATVLNMSTIYPGWSYTGTPVFNLIYSGATGTRTIFLGATSGAFENQVPSLYISAGSDTVVLGASYFKDLNFTGFTGTLSPTGITKYIYGNLTFGTGMTAAASTCTYVMTGSSGNWSITTNGVIVPFNFQFGGSATTAVWTLNDDLNMGTTQRTLYISSGTLNANNKSVTIGSLATVNGTSNIFTLNMGSGTWSLFSPGVIWDVTTVPLTLTLNANTSTIVTTYSSSTNITLNMGSYTYNNLTIGGTAGNNVVTINGGPTINVFTSIKPVAYTVNFDPLNITKFNRFSLSGSAGKLITVSGTGGIQATLKQITGIVSCNYLSISNIIGDASSDWFMGVNSSDAGNNTNIKIANPPWGNAMAFFA